MEARVVVIGAGVAGLACARELARRGVGSTVLEAARDIGGRCATGTFEGERVDHGVAFLHARSREFGDVLRELDPDGHVPGWPVTVQGESMACQPDAYRPGWRRMGRSDGVQALPRHLARDLDVRRGAEVSAIRESGDAFEVACAGQSLCARFVVVACEPARSFALIEPLVSAWPGAAPMLARLRTLPVEPSLTVIAGYALDSPDPGFDICHPLEATMLHTISHDSAKRADARFRVLVMQARSRYSAEHLGDPLEAWAGELLWEAGELIGPWAASPAWHATHRWEVARVLPRNQLGDGLAFPSPRGGGIAVIGDAFASTPGLEGAYLSGVAMAEQLSHVAELRAQPI
jgi:hypothetical protein